MAKKKEVLIVSVKINKVSMHLISDKKTLLPQGFFGYLTSLSFGKAFVLTLTEDTNSRNHFFLGDVSKNMCTVFFT